MEWFAAVGSFFPQVAWGAPIPMWLWVQYVAVTKARLDQQGG